MIRWRTAVHKGANTCETNRIAAAEDRRQARKNRANNPVAGATIPCPHCQRLFRAQIGPTSRLRTHKTSPPPPQDD
uniref:C2H2-type domain-containing protein n=1 Tax=Octopus bimaculoides TaxID=37653 RepID=A0A0L8GUS2_OCTBM